MDNPSPLSAVSQDEINGILWRACDTFRGTIDASEYKNYLLVMLFVKYVSDVWTEHYEELKAVSELMAELVAPQPGERICDPTCGSGSLLIKCANYVRRSGSNDYSLYGQENTGGTNWLHTKNKNAD
jgi:type I restriction-modification system DNA methylase subunit